MYGDQYASATFAGRLPDDYRLQHLAELKRMAREQGGARPVKDPRPSIHGLTAKDEAWQSIFYVAQL